MKKLGLLMSALLISTMVSAQGIEFNNGNLADILKMAQKEKKAIFIDVYTSWCGPCKHMSEKIFTLEKVGNSFNEKFINIKLDAEKSADGKSIAKKFGVTAYPTFLFINGKGELVYRFLGGRDEAGILKEADNAIVAYNSLPLLKKLEKRYVKGERSKEFLNEYFNAKNNSGLDCGELLIEYFNFLSDKEILESENRKRIEKITVYDKDLADRIVNLLLQANSESLLVDKEFNEMNKAVGKFLGGLLSNVARNNQEANFDYVLKLKERYYTIKGNADSVTSASLGGGNLLIPSELLRLDYYDGKAIPAKFMNTMESYIAKLKITNVEKKKSEKEFKESMDLKIKEAEAKNDKATLSMMKKTSGLLSIFGSIDDYYISTTLINFVEKYVQAYQGEKNEEFYNKITDWYQFLFGMSVSCKSAHYVADELLKIGKKDVAKNILTLAMESGQKATAVEQQDIDKCTQLLKTLE